MCDSSEIFQIENNGIGGTPYLKFRVDATPGRDFTQDDLDNNLTACVVSGNNEVGMGEAFRRIFGKVIIVAQDVRNRTVISTVCIVQARGMARFRYDPDLGLIPEINGDIEVAGDGRVIGTIPKQLKDGRVTAVNTENHTCDVWLG